MPSMPLPSTSGQCLCLPIGLRWPSQRHWPWDTPSSWSFAFAFAFAKAPPQGPKRWPWDISTFWRDTDPHRPRDIVTDPRRVVACKLPWPWHEPVQWCLGSTNHLEPTLSIYYGTICTWRGLQPQLLTHFTYNSETIVLSLSLSLSPSLSLLAHKNTYQHLGDLDRF